MEQVKLYEPLSAEESSLDFRQIMKAVSFPGRAQHCLSIPGKNDLSSMTMSLQQIAEALINRDVCVCFSGTLPTENCLKWLTLYLHSQVTELNDADFIITDAQHLTTDLLEKIKVGTDEFPDRSATVLVNWHRPFSQPSDNPVVASGPGINPDEPSLSLNLDDISSEFLSARQQLNNRYPLGVDLFLCAEEEFMALPRTTRLNRKEAC